MDGNDAEDMLLRSSDRFKNVHEFFLGKYSKENFLHIFYWIQNFMDPDKSTELEKYYLKSELV